MRYQQFASRASKVTVPKNAHPAAKIVFAEMRRQCVTYDELEWRSGVLKSTFKAWRTHNAPGLESAQACLGALGWEFIPVPRDSKVLPEDLRSRIDEIAREWGDLDDVMPELIAAVARLPPIVRPPRPGKTDDAPRSR